MTLPPLPPTSHPPFDFRSPPPNRPSSVSLGPDTPPIAAHINALSNEVKIVEKYNTSSNYYSFLVFNRTTHQPEIVEATGRLSYIFKALSYLFSLTSSCTYWNGQTEAGQELNDRATDIYKDIEEFQGLYESATTPDEKNLLRDQFYQQFGNLLDISGKITNLRGPFTIRRDGCNILEALEKFYATVAHDMLDKILKEDPLDQSTKNFLDKSLDIDRFLRGKSYLPQATEDESLSTDLDKKIIAQVDLARVTEAPQEIENWNGVMAHIKEGIKCFSLLAAARATRDYTNSIIPFIENSKALIDKEIKRLSSFDLSEEAPSMEILITRLELLKGQQAQLAALAEEVGAWAEKMNSQRDTTAIDNSKMTHFVLFSEIDSLAKGMAIELTKKTENQQEAICARIKGFEKRYDRTRDEGAKKRVLSDFHREYKSLMATCAAINSDTPAGHFVNGETHNNIRAAMLGFHEHVANSMIKASLANDGSVDEKALLLIAQIVKEDFSLPKDTPQAFKEIYTHALNAKIAGSLKSTQDSIQTLPKNKEWDDVNKYLTDGISYFSLMAAARPEEDCAGLLHVFIRHSTTLINQKIEHLSSISLSGSAPQMETLIPMLTELEAQQAKLASLAQGVRVWSGKMQAQGAASKGPQALLQGLENLIEQTQSTLAGAVAKQQEAICRRIENFQKSYVGSDEQTRKRTLRSFNLDYQSLMATCAAKGTDTPAGRFVNSGTHNVRAAMLQFHETVASSMIEACLAGKDSLEKARRIAQTIKEDFLLPKDAPQAFKDIYTTALNAKINASLQDFEGEVNTEELAAQLHTALQEHDTSTGSTATSEKQTDVMMFIERGIAFFSLMAAARPSVDCSVSLKTFINRTTALIDQEINRLNSLDLSENAPSTAKDTLKATLKGLQAQQAKLADFAAQVEHWSDEVTKQGATSTGHQGLAAELKGLDGKMKGDLTRTIAEKKRAAEESLKAISTRLKALPGELEKLTAAHAKAGGGRARLVEEKAAAAAEEKASIQKAVGLMQDRLCKPESLALFQSPPAFLSSEHKKDMQIIAACVMLATQKNLPQREALSKLLSQQGITNTIAFNDFSFLSASFFTERCASAKQALTDSQRQFFIIQEKAKFSLKIASEAEKAFKPKSTDPDDSLIGSTLEQLGALKNDLQKLSGGFLRGDDPLRPLPLIKGILDRVSLTDTTGGKGPPTIDDIDELAAEIKAVLRPDEYFEISARFFTLKELIKRQGLADKVTQAKRLFDVASSHFVPKSPELKLLKLFEESFPEASKKVFAAPKEFEASIEASDQEIGRLADEMRRIEQETEVAKLAQTNLQGILGAFPAGN